MFTQKHDKQKAIFLRQLGWTHKQIAEYIGCHESWCRHELSKIKPEKELMYAVAKEAMLDYCIVEVNV